MLHQEPRSQLRAALYIRISTEEQKEKYGVDLQRSAIEAVVKAKGKLDDGEAAMVLAGSQYVYIDEAISGTIEMQERPAFSRLMEDIELAPEDNKPFDVVIVYKIDRFARRLKILLEVVDFLENHNIKFISANESIDTSSPFGRAILGILGVIAELEIETTKQRTQDGRVEAIQKGVFMGQAAPYGYKKNLEKRLEIIDVEAEVVRQMFSWFVFENKTTQQIADQLKADMTLSPDASAVVNEKRKGFIKKKNDSHFWRAEKVREILSDRIYLGEYWYNKTKTDKKTKKTLDIPKNEWKLSGYKYPRIIEMAVFNRALSRIDESNKRMDIASKSRYNHLYLLSGLLRCADCAGKSQNHQMMTFIGEGKRIAENPDVYTYYYKCGRKNSKKYSETCDVLPIPAEPVENYVVDFAKRLLKDPKRVFEYHLNTKSYKNQVKNLEVRRDKLTNVINMYPRQISHLREQHRDGYIDSIQLRKDVTEIEGKRATRESELKEINAKLDRCAISRGYFDSLKLFAEKYQMVVDQMSSDRQEQYELLHALVNKITVTSRPICELDHVAGAKKDNQKIPWSIEIELKLPQDMIIDLAEKEFLVKNADL